MWYSGVQVSDTCKQTVVDDYDEPEQSGSWSKWDSDHVLGLLLSLPIV